MNEQTKYFIAFSCVPAIGPTKFNLLYSYFSSLATAWQAPYSELLQSGLDEKSTKELITVRNKINLDEILETLDKHNIQVLTLENPDYPPLLKQIHNPPFLLYYKGILSDPRDEFAISVVGTRKISTYGKQVTHHLVSDLTHHQLVIVSGLAFGVDALAHQTCLEAGGRTIAVVACGLDKNSIYPAANLDLAKDIVSSGGLILSEYPPFTQPQKFFFPQRNRIVSGLSLGTLVIEAPLKSGALLTAKLALDQNREVFATPGNILSANSAGPHQLIKLGAKLVSETEDILDTLNLSSAESFLTAKKIIASSPLEAKILKNLSHEPTHIDELIRLSGLDSATINSTLTLMEITGKVKNLGAMMYVISR